MLKSSQEGAVWGHELKEKRDVLVHSHESGPCPTLQVVFLKSALAVYGSVTLKTVHSLLRMQHFLSVLLIKIKFSQHKIHFSEVLCVKGGDVGSVQLHSCGSGDNICEVQFYMNSSQSLNLYLFFLKVCRRIFENIIL